MSKSATSIVQTHFASFADFHTYYRSEHHGLTADLILFRDTLAGRVRI